MGKKSKKQSQRKEKSKKNVIDKISADDALTILRNLAEKDKTLLKKIEEAALEYLREVDIEDVAYQVFEDLNSLEVEEVWDQSGSTIYGYVEPGDKAWEMFEEAVAPYLNELKKCQKIGLHEKAKKYCMGILKGIYEFEKESATQFKDWATDAPGECFKMVLDDWKKACKNLKDVKEMNGFVKKYCPDWS